MFALIQSSKFWLLLAATSLSMVVPVCELLPLAAVLLAVLEEPVLEVMPEVAVLVLPTTVPVLS